MMFPKALAALPKTTCAIAAAIRRSEEVDEN